MATICEGAAARTARPSASRALIFGTKPGSFLMGVNPAGGGTVEVLGSSVVVVLAVSVAVAVDVPVIVDVAVSMDRHVSPRPAIMLLCSLRTCLCDGKSVGIRWTCHDYCCGNRGCDS